MRVLVIEDNDEFAALITAYLTKSGFDSDRCKTAEQAEQMSSAVKYAAIILDLGLPGGDGLDLLRNLRSRGDSTAVLIASARHGLEDRILGLAEGADDYLAKPFALDELVARLRALLRRPGNFIGSRLSMGNIELNVEDRQVIIAGRLQPVRLREVVLLEILMRHKGNVVPRRFLEDQLFGAAGEQDSNTIDVYIHRLRRQLIGARASAMVHTIRGVGYMLSETTNAEGRLQPR